MTRFQKAVMDGEITTNMITVSGLAVDNETGKIAKCSLFDCEECRFGLSVYCTNDVNKWLNQEASGSESEQKPEPKQDGLPKRWIKLTFNGETERPFFMDSSKITCIESRRERTYIFVKEAGCVPVKETSEEILRMIAEAEGRKE